MKTEIRVKQQKPRDTKEFHKPPEARGEEVGDKCLSVTANKVCLPCDKVNY